MTSSTADLAVFYGTFFAAHVALLAIALPLSAALLIAQAERYSPRVLGALIRDAPLVAMAALIVLSAVPALFGLYLVVQPAPERTYVIPGVVIGSFVLAVVLFFALLERTRRLIQPRRLVRSAITNIPSAEWAGKALARFGPELPDHAMLPLDDLMRVWTTLPSGASASEDEQEAMLEQLRQEKAQADASAQELRLRRERLLAAQAEREDALAAATGIALRAIEDHDIWTLAAYVEALRDSVLLRVNEPPLVLPFGPDDAAVAIIQLVCHDHLTPLFEEALEGDLRAARILLETMQELALGGLANRPEAVSHVVARLDGWLSLALRHNAAEELVSRQVRVLGSIGHNAVEAGKGDVATHVIQSLAHAGEVVPTAFWVDAPHVYNRPDVEEPEATWSVAIELHDAVTRMATAYKERGELAAAPWVEGVQIIASAFMERTLAVGASTWRNERIWHFTNEIHEEAKRALLAGNDNFAVLPIARLTMLLDTATRNARSDSRKYDDVRDPHRVRDLQEDLFYLGSLADSKTLPMSAKYAFDGLIRSDPAPARVRSLFYELLPGTLGDEQLTTNGVIAFARRLCQRFGGHLGLKPCGATEAEASAALRDDPDVPQ